jgi:hypothetical protein
MTTFAEDIEKAAGGESIEGIVISLMGWDEDDRQPRDKGVPVGRVVTWTEVRRFLDYEYDSGFGGADCHAVYVWTATRVLFVHEYDGSTGMSSVPRHPVDCKPCMSGE